ncbi:uncharacterized protein N7483_004614 [Penicillium malachiteum]|uniref:uncharacterized protein n=1 Tax=Penicillium malachiteum TaxID=1324776 RepID=UPI0025485A2F|nr:uncharacterized protein N7483_004614 [Penicillium malachiteum]KAJ5730106.1 hypothetical protein N7483_004614 [Penicillium malachiteum]
MDRPQPTSLHNFDRPSSSFSHGYDQYPDETESFSGNAPPPDTLMDQSTQPHIPVTPSFHHHTSSIPDYEESYMYYNANEPPMQEPVPRTSTAGSQPKITTEWIEPMTINHSFSPKSPKRSSSPIEYGFIMEDPTNPQRCAKRARSRSELDKQKEDIRQLRDNGGACTRCYKSKKKCSTSTPCDPCLASRAKCIRRETRSLLPRNKRSYTSDVEVSSSPSVDPDVVDGMLDATPWELAGSIDGTDCDLDADCDFDTGI